MNFVSTENGFRLERNGTSFTFSAKKIPTCCEDFVKLTVRGTIPVPKIISGDRILLPVDEGIALAAEGEYEFGNISSDFCSRGGTMSMIIIERNGQYLLCALDTGAYARYELIKESGLYQLSMYCTEPCEVQYIICSTLAEACRYYRRLKAHLLSFLENKISALPESEKLIGGAIFWVWNDDYERVMYSDENPDISPCAAEFMLQAAEKLYARGVKKALFGIFFGPDGRAAAPLYNKFGYISTKYDNYNDVPRPDMLKFIPKNRILNCDYSQRRIKDYPDGVQTDTNGELTKAWALRGYDGKMHDQNTLCPKVAAQRMKEEIPAQWEEFPAYEGRFIDVYGGGIASCSSKKHPVTRGECIQIKNKAFRFVSDLGLITGTEDGFEDIIGSILYNEGMNSPFHFRFDKMDCGRRKAQDYGEEGAAFQKKYMLNPACRVPLWHLVYHDCVISFPYWGDAINSCRETMQDKALFSCLYGCPPLYSFFAGNFDALEEEIVRTYHMIAEVTEKVTTLPMTDFVYLTKDFTVQKTVFGGRYTVVANFSEKDFEYKGVVVKAHNKTFIEGDTK